MRVWFAVALLLLAGCAGTQAPGTTAPGTTASAGTPTTSVAPSTTGPGTGPGSQAAPSELVAGNTAFAVDLLKASMAREQGKNLFTSPLSVSVALAMAHAGAEGGTKQAMRDALHFPNVPDAALDGQFAALLAALAQEDPRATVEVGNSLWIDKQFAPAVRDDYRARVEGPYGGQATLLDLQGPEAVPAINTWASEQTHGMVPKVLDEIADEEVLFLINAVYFKGDWAAPFNKTCTHKADFRRTDGAVVQADMMCGMPKANVTASFGDGYVAARIPYAGHRLAMYVIVPNEGSTPGALLDRWDGAQFTAVLDGVDGTFFDRVEIPKLRLKTHLDLKPALADLGMDVAFGEFADFSGIAGKDVPLALSRVLHDAVVEVDEEGTVAAAVTTVGVGVTAAPPPVVADRPFILAIRHEETGTVLFLGVVEDPTAE
jgi:serine protease inhibitor